MKKLMVRLLAVSSWVILTGALFGQNNTVVPDTGIYVGEPKVYDDQSLAVMLNAARAQLAAVRPIDQASLLSHLGAVQGASLTQTSFGLQVNGPPAAGIVTTTGSGTPSTVQTVGATTATAAGATSSTTTTSNQNVTTTPSATTQNVVTQPAVTAPTVTAPAPTATMPAASSYSVSATSTLNEQMQLSYEIANLELLLEGALSDRFVKGSTILKTRTTVGFPITIVPPSNKRLKNAVAEVEVRIKNAGCSLAEAPSLVSILPREKTYNVANITDKSVSIGGGVVTQVASVGATWMWGHKTYYLVQDQDTIAMQRQASDGNEVAFGWQFRPVLGQKMPRSGMRQTFAQLAFDTLAANPDALGTVEVVTRWRQYDDKTGTAGKVIMESAVHKSSIPQYPPPMADRVDMEDTGGGQITVTAGGGFLTGTRVRIGSVTMGESTPNFSLTPTSLQFTAPAVAVALDPPRLVNRDGTEVELLQPSPTVGVQRPKAATCPPKSPIAETKDVKQAAEQPTAPQVDLRKCPQANAALTAEARVAICRISVRPYTDTQSEVTVELLKNPPDPARRNPLLAVIGNKLFGLSDSPFLESSPNSLRFLAGNDVINSYRAVTVKRLFWGLNYSAWAEIAELSYDTVAKVNLIATGDESVLAISGVGVDKIRVLSPSTGVRLEPITLEDRATKANMIDSTTILMHVDGAQLKGLKQFVFQINQQPPIIVAVPTDAKADDSKATASKPSLKAQDPIPPGTGVTITVSGTGLDSIKTIKYLKSTLNFRLALDKKSMTVELPAEVTSTEGVRYLDILYTDGTSARYEIDVKKK